MTIINVSRSIHNLQWKDGDASTDTEHYFSFVKFLRTVHCSSGVVVSTGQSSSLVIFVFVAFAYYQTYLSSVTLLLASSYLTLKQRKNSPWLLPIHAHAICARGFFGLELGMTGTVSILWHWLRVHRIQNMKL